MLLPVSGLCPHLSPLTSGLGYSSPFLQESLPFLLCSLPRMLPAPFQLHHISHPTLKRGLSNLSSILSSNSVTKNNSHCGFSQSYVHILYIFNQHVCNQMYILFSVHEFYVICFICINIPHIYITVHYPRVQCNGSSTLKYV